MTPTRTYFALVSLCISFVSALNLNQASPPKPVKQCESLVLDQVAKRAWQPDCRAFEQYPPEISKFLETAAQSSPHSAEYWADEELTETKYKYPLTADMVKAAMTPNGHAGSWAKIVSKVGTASYDKRKLQIAVLGGSMTIGGGLPETDRDAWPERLKRIVPFGVEIVNLARAGTTSQYPFAHFHDVYEPLSKADVVIVDYAVNDFSADGILCCGLGAGCGDWEPCFAVKDPPTFPLHNDSTTANMAALKNVVRLVASLPNKPAVVFLETFQHDLGYNCDHDVTKHSHWPTIQDFDLAVISYKNAFCKLGRTMWSDKSGQDTQNPHPSAATHELVAHLVGGSINMQVRQACRRENGHLHDDSIPPIKDSNFECVVNPITELNEFSNFAGAAKDVVGWRWYEDTPGKLGWIAEGKDNTITFPIHVNHGQLTIEFLSTYDNIGSAYCSIDAEDLCEIQGFWNHKSSQSNFATLHTSSKGQAQVTCKSDGHKFKIISISTC